MGTGVPRDSSTVMLTKCSSPGVRRDWSRGEVSEGHEVGATRGTTRNLCVPYKNGVTVRVP